MVEFESTTNASGCFRVMPVQEIELNFYKSYNVERWMWECPQCHEESSVHVNERYNPTRLVCSQCYYAVHPLEAIGTDFSETIEGVSVPMECPKTSRLTLAVETMFGFTTPARFPSRAR